MPTPSSSSTSPPPSAPPQSSSPSSSAAMSAKAEEIRRVLSDPVVDLWRLRDLAIAEGGLVNDTLRVMAWPKLVGIHNDGYDHVSRSSIPGEKTKSQPRPPPQPRLPQSLSMPHPPLPPSSVPPSLDAEQIERDVSRCTWHLLTGTQRSRNFQMKNKHRKRVALLLKRKQRRLGDYINLVLVQGYASSDGATEGGALRYYQGYHDVASVVLSTLGGVSAQIVEPRPGQRGGGGAVGAGTDDARQTSPSEIDAAATSARTLAASTGLDLASLVLLRLSRSHFRDAMRPDFDSVTAALRIVILPLMAAFDPEVHAHLVDCYMEPFFALSWIITWFSHDVRDTSFVKRLFDFFLVSHPLMSAYLSVAMVLHPLNRIEVLCADCDFACVHHALANLPKNSCQVGWRMTGGEEGTGCDTNEEDDLSSEGILTDQSNDGDEEASTISATVLQNSMTSRVPFQELIDLSISLMRKIPPRNLVALAARYRKDVSRAPLAARASSIALLQPPPSWGLASLADSDWVLRQRLWNERGLRLNRRQRRNRSRMVDGGGSGGGDDGSASPSPSKKPRAAASAAAENHGATKGETSPYRTADSQMHEAFWSQRPIVNALIASGMGPDGSAEEREQVRRWRIAFQSAVVVLVAVAYALIRAKFFTAPGAAGVLERGEVEERNLVEKNLRELRELLEDVGLGPVCTDGTTFCREEELAEGDGPGDARESVLEEETDGSSGGAVLLESDRDLNSERHVAVEDVVVDESSSRSKVNARDAGEKLSTVLKADANDHKVEEPLYRDSDWSTGAAVLSDGKSHAAVKEAFVGDSSSRPKEEDISDAAGENVSSSSSAFEADDYDYRDAEEEPLHHGYNDSIDFVSKGETLADDDNSLEAAESKEDTRTTQENNSFGDVSDGVEFRKEMELTFRSSEVSIREQERSLSELAGLNESSRSALSSTARASMQKLMHALLLRCTAALLTSRDELAKLFEVITNLVLTICSVLVGHVVPVLAQMIRVLGVNWRKLTPTIKGEVFKIEIEGEAEWAEAARKTWARKGRENTHHLRRLGGFFKRAKEVDSRQGNNQTRKDAREEASESRKREI